MADEKAGLPAPGSGRRPDLATIALAHTPPAAVSPFFLAGMLIVAAGAAIVLAFGPRGHAPAK